MLVPAAASVDDYRRLLSAIAERGIGRVRTDRANYRGTFPPSLMALMEREGERFADESDERLVTRLCAEMDLGRRAAAPAEPTPSEQLSLF
jgi:hypothetical protein